MTETVNNKPGDTYRFADIDTSTFINAKYSIPLKQVFIESHLITLDVMCSHKMADFSLWPPATVKWAVDNGIILKGKAKYGSGANVRSNHVRVYVGYFNGEHVAFEWTYPRARFVKVEQWMLDPSYCLVYRHKDMENVTVLSPHFSTGEAWLEELVKKHFEKHEDSKYDWLQLPGIALGAEWLQISDKREVCSSGAHEALASFLSFCFQEVEQWNTMPCTFMNHPEYFSCKNIPFGVSVPICRKRIGFLNNEPRRLQTAKISRRTS